MSVYAENYVYGLRYSVYIVPGNRLSCVTYALRVPSYQDKLGRIDVSVAVGHAYITGESWFNVLSECKTSTLNYSSHL